MEKGQYRTALELSQKAIAMCEKALQTGIYPGYSERLVREISSYLYNVIASVEFELSPPDSSLALYSKVRDIRESNKRPGNLEDEMWIAAANGNIAISLMAENRADDALIILRGLLARDDMKPNRDTYLNNTSLCLTLLGRLDEALEVCERAIDLVQELRGAKSIQMAV